MIDPTGLARMAGARVKAHGASATPHAIVKDGIVINVVLWDKQESPGWKPTDGEAIPCDATVSRGHTWADEKFTDPAPRPARGTLDDAKAHRIMAIDRAYRDASQGLFVDDAKRDAMKAQALAAVDAVRAAQTHEDALSIMRGAVADLESAAKA